MTSISRSQFLKMNHTAQMSHIRSGFAIINDPEVIDPFEGAKEIVNGLDRLKWIETRKKQLAFDAETAEMRKAAEQG
jgi:hypothetical protein